MATRASDAERERCALALRDHAAAGRLTVAELESRLERAYSARYRWELRSVLRDLPSGVGRRVACVVDRVDRLFLRAHVASFAFVTLLTVGLWEVAGRGAFWPAVLIAPWAMMLAMHVGGSWGVRRLLSASPRRHRRQLPA